MPESEESPAATKQSKIFDAIEKNDAVLLKTLLTENPQHVNTLDKDKMTPLQHAAYKGNKEMVQMLLDQGADVRLCEHQHNYTALHFAALSGNSDVCLALLMAGAKAMETNTVGRTPPQMAAFVGHHNCVAIINNYVPIADVEYYTKGNKLPSFLVSSFHKFLMHINIHPVKVVINLFNYVGLQDHLDEVKKVLCLMSEKEMKRGAETNEAMAFKLHYLSYIVGEIIKLKQRQSAQSRNEEDKKPDIVEIFAKKLLKVGKDDNLEFMDAFLKECVREFPYRESTMFRHLVQTLSSDKSADALFIINCAINGQRGFIDNVPHCDTCGEEKPAKKCSKCKVVQYCDRNCQRLHWAWHKKSCARLGQEAGDPAKGAKGEKNNIDLTELQNYLVEK